MATSGEEIDRLPLSRLRLYQFIELLLYAIWLDSTTTPQFTVAWKDSYIKWYNLYRKNVGVCHYSRRISVTLSESFPNILNNCHAVGFYISSLFCDIILGNRSKIYNNTYLIYVTTSDACCMVTRKAYWFNIEYIHQDASYQKKFLRPNQFCWSSWKQLLLYAILAALMVLCMCKPSCW